MEKTKKSMVYKTTDTPLEQERKSQFIKMFFLCMFFGPLGIHKFIEGKKKLGLIYIFTGGLFYFGVVFDLLYYGVNGFGKCEFERKPKPTFITLIVGALVGLIVFAIIITPPHYGKFSASNGDTIYFANFSRTITISNGKANGKYKYKIKKDSMTLYDGDDEIAVLYYEKGESNVLRETVIIDNVQYVKYNNPRWSSITSDSSLSGNYYDSYGNNWKFGSGTVTVSQGTAKIKRQYKIKDGYLFMKSESDDNYTYYVISDLGNGMIYLDGTVLTKRN